MDFKCKECGAAVNPETVPPACWGPPEGPHYHGVRAVVDGQEVTKLCGPVLETSEPQPASAVTIEPSEPEEAPILEAKDLNIAHLVLCAMTLEATVCAAALIARADVDVSVSELHLRRMTRKLVLACKHEYNAPYPDESARFQAIVNFVKGSVRQTAQRLATNALATPQRAPLVGPDGKPVRAN